LASDRSNGDIEKWRREVGGKEEKRGEIEKIY
jgi:hypothetical protein